MQVDWKVLNKLPIEKVVNNLILVMNLDIDSKQRLLDSSTVTQLQGLFSKLINGKENPILVSTSDSKFVN